MKTKSQKHIFKRKKEAISWGQGRTKRGKEGIFKILRVGITKAVQTQCECENPHPQASHNKNHFSYNSAWDKVTLYIINLEIQQGGHNITENGKE